MAVWLWSMLLSSAQLFGRLHFLAKHQNGSLFFGVRVTSEDSSY